jgi:hypothetical protein
VRTTHLILGLALTLLGASAAAAQEFHYDLEGRFGWYGARFDSTLSLTKREDGRYDAVRSWSYREEGAAPRMTGVADVRVRRRNGETEVRIKVTFKPKAGAADALADLGQTETGKATTGNYKVSGERITGWVQVTGRNGKSKNVYESGRRTKHPIDHGDYDAAAEAAAAIDGDTGGSGGIADVTSDDPQIEGDTLKGTLDTNLRILRPGAGVYLAGQQIRLETAGAAPDKVQVVSGNAKISGRTLTITGDGEIRIQLKKGKKISMPVDLEAVTAEITAVTVLDTITIADAKPPHLKRTFQADSEEYTWEPAAILQDTQLRLRVTLTAAKDLTGPAKVRIVGSEADFEIEEEIVVQSLAGGQEVELISAEALTDSIQVNTLDLEWAMGPDKGQVKTNMTPLRVYTVYGQPVNNPLPQYGPTQRQGHPLNTKLHFELVCTWAQGATKNVGNGEDSIAYKIDNAMRHHVAWKDYKDNVPKVPHYPKGAKPPLNYSKIPGSVTKGKRSVSSLYYPSQDATAEVEQYHHYQNNFGWWLLDNPVYAGGRCNQQASLICDLVGTIGMEAEVYYIERVSVGPLSGRPVRRYYRSSRSSKSWNFHGQAKVKMADGTFWLYDGSGSSPPRRINGKVEELMAVPGPYVKYWESWRYEDGDRRFVPMNDWPKTWRGVPLMKGEPPLDPKAADGTYAYKIGSGRMDKKGSDSKFHDKLTVFYVVNVGGQFVYKVGEGKVDAPTYQSAVHGGIAKWFGG